MSGRLQAAVDSQIAAGAPSALARIEASGDGLTWSGCAGDLARVKTRPLAPDHAFRVASVTKSVTAAVVVKLASDGRVALDTPLANQLDPKLLDRWHALDALPRTTPRQLLAHTAGLPNYFGDETSSRGCARNQAALGARSSSSTMQLRMEPRTSRPVGLPVFGHRVRGRRNPVGAGDHSAAP